MYSHSFMGWGIWIPQLLYKLDLRYFNGSLYTHSAMYWPPLGGIFGQILAKIWLKMPPSGGQCIVLYCANLL